MASHSSKIPAELSVVGIDIGKAVFHIVGFDQGGKVVLRRKIKRIVWSVLRSGR